MTHPNFKHLYAKGINMKTWQIGIVGVGMISDFHSLAIQSLPNTALAGITTRNYANAKTFSEKHHCTLFDSLEAMLASDDIDIITIATPSGTHSETAIAAAKAGKHVLCEKPLDITLERVDAMIAAHKSAGTYLGGIFQNRYNEAMTPLRQAIEDDRFGKITCCSIFVPWWRDDSYYENSWHGTWNIDGGGALMNQSIHMIDMLCDLMGDITEVRGFSETLGHEHCDTEDTSVAIFKFATGALGFLHGTTASWPGGEKRFEITGTAGTAIYLEDGFSKWQFRDEQPQDATIRKTFKPSAASGAANPAAMTHINHAKNISDFVKAIENKKPFALDGETARKSIELILKIYNAAKNKDCI